MLVVAQVVLALQLPFTLVPLIKATSSPALMGPFASSWLRSGAAWAASALVFAANLLMLLDMLRLDTPEPSGADGLKEWSVPGGVGEWLHQAGQLVSKCGLLFTWDVVCESHCYGCAGRPRVCCAVHSRPLQVGLESLRHSCVAAVLAESSASGSGLPPKRCCPEDLGV